MDLHTGEPYWLLKNGYTQSFPALTGDCRTEVCVIGGGITGALAAYALAKEGAEVTVLDRRHPGMGSTCASTALLQYEIDEPLHSLIDIAGRKRAEGAYCACHQAIDEIAAIVTGENLAIEFTPAPSLQYASKRSHVRDLKDEYKARRAIDIEVDLLTGQEVRERYGIDAPAGLWSRQGAQVDAYQLAHALLGQKRDNLRVYDTCEVRDLRATGRGVTLRTGDGHTVKARHVVVCCGYESRRFLPKQMAEMSSTYALASKPLGGEPPWPDRTLIWETKDPYLYLRTTADNRIIAGGRDDDGDNARKRRGSLAAKTARLTNDIRKLRPDIPLHLDFTWAGAFGGTKDSLAYVGRAEEARVWYILGFGGNGIVFSQTGAGIVRDGILGRKNPLADLYTFDR